MSSVNRHAPAAARPSISFISRDDVAVLLATTRTCLTPDSIGCLQCGFASARPNTNVPHATGQRKLCTVRLDLAAFSVRHSVGVTELVWCAHLLRAARFVQGRVRRLGAPTPVPGRSESRWTCNPG